MKDEKGDDQREATLAHFKETHVASRFLSCLLLSDECQAPKQLALLLRRHLLTSHSLAQAKAVLLCERQAKQNTLYSMPKVAVGGPAVPSPSS